MATDPKQDLRDAVDRLSEIEARRLAVALREIGTVETAPPARPLTEADVVLAEPILPDDETADQMIVQVRRWRREGGDA